MCFCVSRCACFCDMFNIMICVLLNYLSGGSLDSWELECLSPKENKK